MAADYSPLETAPQHRASDVTEGSGTDVAAFVAVEVDVEPPLGGALEQTVEQSVDLGRHVGDGAQDPARGRDPVRQLVALACAEGLQRHQ